MHVTREHAAQLRGIYTDVPEQAVYVYRAEDGNITNICGGSFAELPG